MKNQGWTLIGPQKGMGQVKAWIIGARPHTWSATFVPISVGVSLAAQEGAKIDWIIAFFTLLSALLIQIGANLTNDALDFKKGVDTEGRVGFQRMTQAGWMPQRDVLVGGFICFALAFVCGIPLIMLGGWPFLFVLLSSITFAYLYTGGPFPLSYHGLAEVFTLLFFGLVSTTTAYYLQMGAVHKSVVIAGLQVGLLASVIIAINNLRDIENDAKQNKRTLAVRFGMIFARIEITCFTFLPFILGFYWSYFGYPLATLLPYLVLPLSYQNVKAIWNIKPSIAYNRFLARSALIQLLFGIFLILGYVLS